VAAGQAVGFLLAYEFDAETAATGNRDLYVGTVGTLAPWRGRGIGGALLAFALGRAQEQGFGSSSLTVDAENATGALGVYARAGYVLHRRDITFAPGT
jgi:ribosomal protein S18 acetylase RimI-like enzyme